MPITFIVRRNWAYPPWALAGREAEQTDKNNTGGIIQVALLNYSYFPILQY